jgi:hypothetical protein
MSVQRLPEELLLYVTDMCGRIGVLAFARTCHEWQNILRCKRRCVLLATPIRIQSGMLMWLNNLLDGSHPVPMSKLSLEYRVSEEFTHLQSAFLFTVFRAMTAFHSIELVIQNSPISIVSLVHALQNIQTGGVLVLDLSYHRGVTSTQIKALWTIAVRLSVFKLKLHNTDVDDATVVQIAHSIDTSPHPVVWTALKLGLSHNFISDRGLSTLIKSIGKCSNLKDLNLNLSYNDIVGPNKLDVCMASVGHIPSVRIKLDSDCWDTDLSTLTSTTSTPDHWRQ